MSSRRRVGLREVKKSIEDLNLKVEDFQQAELYTAIERLIGAEETSSSSRRTQILHDADSSFQKFRNYYFQILHRIRPLNRISFSVEQSSELYARYYAICQAELQANFLLNDYKQWNFRHKLINEQLTNLHNFDLKDILAARVNAMPAATSSDIDAVKMRLKSFRDFSTETLQRIDSGREEIGFLEARSIHPREYLERFEKADPVGVVLVRHDLN